MGDCASKDANAEEQQLLHSSYHYSSSDRYGKGTKGEVMNVSTNASYAENKIQPMKNEIARLKNENGQLKQRQEHSRLKIQQLESELQQFREKNQSSNPSQSMDMEKRLQLKYEEKMKKVKQREIQFQKMLEKEQQMVADLQKRLHSFSEDVKKSNLEKENVENDLADAEANIRFFGTEMERLKVEHGEEIHRINQEIHASQVSNTQLLQAVEKIKTKFSEERRRALEESQKLRDEIASISMVRDLAFKNAESLENSLQIVKDENAKQIQLLSADVEDRDRQCDLLRDELHAMGRKHSEALDQVDQLQHTLVALEAAHAQLVEKNTSPTLISSLVMTEEKDVVPSSPPMEKSSVPEKQKKEEKVHSEGVPVEKPSTARESKKSVVIPDDEFVDDLEDDSVHDVPGLQRALVAAEMVKVEKQYVSDLELVVHHFSTPLREKQAEAEANEKPDVLPKAAHQDIFSSLEIILSHHKMFADEIEQRVIGVWKTQKPEDRVVGDVLQVLVKQHLSGYFSYISNYSHALYTIRECTKNYPLFREYLRTPMLRKKCGSFTLSDYLIRPIQQLPRYVLLMQELLRNTPKGHKDYSLVRTCLQDMQNVANKINEQMRESANGRKVFSVQCSLVGKSVPNLLEPGRRWIAEGHFELERGKKSKSRYLILFNDLLVEAAKKKSKSSDSEKNEKDVVYKYKRTFPLQYVSVSIAKDDERVIQVCFGKKKRKIVRYLAEDESQAEKFCNMLSSQCAKTQQQDDALSVVETRIKNRLSSFAYKSIPDLKQVKSLERR